MNATTQLRNFLAQDETLRSVFTLLTKWTSREPLSIDDIMTATHLPRPVLVHLFKTLDQTGLVNFVAGRRGVPSRVHFYFTPVSIGKVALGRIDTLERIDIAKLAQQNVASPFAGGAARPSNTAQPFTVRKNAKGVVFFLPENASVADAQALASYIRRQQYKNVA